MRNFPTRILLLVGTVSISLLLLLSLSACGTPALTAIPSPTRTFTFNPYHTPTASLAPTQATPHTPPTIPVTPTPTATPFLHTVKKEETMLGIALTYGIELTDLLSANPEVDPHFMSVGITLTIPITGEAFTAAPVITPVPLDIDLPACYRISNGGAWCLALVHNNQTQAVENVSAVIGLFSSAGETLAAQEAFLPLNRLGPDQSMPLGGYFPPPLPLDFTARVELLTAVEVNEAGGRYLDAGVFVETLEIAPTGLEAHLTGTVVITPGAQVTGTLPASLVWVSAVAYDSDGVVVGVRKWESTAFSACYPPEPASTPGLTPTPLPPLPDECFQFDLTIYTLGPPIARVDVFTEVRP